MTPRGLNGDWARLIVDSLVKGGARDFVLSPGSRSTPLVLAVLERKDVHVHTLLDERVAGFFALGRGRATGRPAVLVCTSGTAPAHYAPAVLEARSSETPLLVVSADRPASLQQVRAAQTVEQDRMFGAAAVDYVDLGEPTPRGRALRSLPSRIQRAVLRARYPTPGAVHLNVRMAKPFEPPQEPTLDDIALEQRVDELCALGSVHSARPRVAPATASMEQLRSALTQSRRPLLVAGPVALHHGAAAWPRQLLDFANTLEIPVCAELTSQLCGFADRRVFRSASLVLEALDPSELGVDCVVQVGAPPVSPGWNRLFDRVRSEAPPRFVLGEVEWTDPQHSAGCHVFGDLEETVGGLVGLEREVVDEEWLPLWRSLEATTKRAIERQLESAGADAPLAEGAVARECVGVLPEGALFAVGNSLPIRLVESYWAQRETPLRVWSQRGANGIDGILSGVAGSTAALAERGEEPAATLVLLGDISFLHDVGGLAALAAIRDQVAGPVVVVVINNAGGRIFEQLPVASRIGSEELAAWTTPHGFDLASAASLYGHRFARAHHLNALGEALGDALARDETTVLEAVVPPSAAVSQRQRLVASLTRRLGGK